MNLKLKHKLLFLTLLFFLISFNSDTGWKKISSFQVKADFFTTDNLGNVYVIRQDEIIKFNSKGGQLKKYSNKRLGKIFSVDATNPLRILVYYKEFSVVVFLDNQLTENGESIPLEEHELEQADLVCTSFNNGMWFFNRQNMELVRLNQTLDKVLNTGNLNRLFGLSLQPNFLMEYNGYVYLNDPSVGILVFDIFGTYFKTVYLKGLNSFQVKEQSIIYQANSYISNYHIKELSNDSIALPDKLILSTQIQKNQFYFLYKDSICVYLKDKS